MECCRYAFNGKELDNDGEWGSGTTAYDYGFRIYNPAIARFLSVDPLAPDYPWYTPYQFAGNKPLIAIDIDGLEEQIVVLEYGSYVKDGLIHRTSARYLYEREGDKNYRWHKNANPDEYGDGTLFVYRNTNTGEERLEYNPSLSDYYEKMKDGIKSVQNFFSVKDDGIVGMEVMTGSGNGAGSMPTADGISTGIVDELPVVPGGGAGSKIGEGFWGQLTQGLDELTNALTVGDGLFKDSDGSGGSPGEESLEGAAEKVTRSEQNDTLYILSSTGERFIIDQSGGKRSIEPGDPVGKDEPKKLIRNRDELPDK